MLAAVTGCTIIQGRTWVGTYSGSPLAFSTSTDSAGAVWNRARDWFGGFTTPRLAVDSDTLLQSAETKSGEGMYTVAMTRTDSAGAVYFTVRYTSFDPKDKDVLKRGQDRAEELAYISRTGDNQQAFIQRGAE